MQKKCVLWTELHQLTELFPLKRQRSLRSCPYKLHNCLQRTFPREADRKGRSPRSPAPLGRERPEGAKGAEAAARVAGNGWPRRPGHTARPCSGLRGAAETLGRVGQRHGPRRRPIRPGAHGPGPRGRHPVRCLLQGALPDPARLLRAGLAAAHELPVLLHRRLGDPQHPPAGTHLEPSLPGRPPETRKMASAQAAPPAAPPGRA